MDDARPTVDSFGALARRCTRSPTWPEFIKSKERSLAALFSKIDRSQELEWLADRPGAIATLISVLGCEPGRVHEHLQLGLEQSDLALRRWRIPDAPQARPVSLLEELLPPGLPRILSTPNRWMRLWWQGPTGADVELARDWLTARGLADVGSGTSPIRTATPSATVVPRFFIHLPPDPLPKDVVTAESLICVASPQPPPDASWEPLRSLAEEGDLAKLLNWFQERLPQDEHFVAQDVLEWLQLNLPPEDHSSFGTVVGLAAWLDEVGTQTARGRGRGALARTFLRHRLHQTVVLTDSEPQWLLEHCWDALVGAAMQALLSSGDSLDAPRSEAQWLELIPEEYRKGIDAQWAAATLGRPGIPLGREELDKLLGGTPPGSFRLVRALEQARLLGGAPPGTWRLRPEWFAKRVSEAAEEALLDGSSRLWGNALLHHSCAGRLRASLLERISRGDFRALDDALEAEPRDEDPAFACALDVLTELVGLSLLDGQDVSQEHIDDLVTAQAQLCVEEDGIPRPRVGCTASPQAQWRLGAWALTERASSPPQHLRTISPWAPGATALSAQLDEIEEHLSRIESTSWLSGAFELVFRLTRTHRSPDVQRHALCAPCQVASWNVEDVRLEELDRLVSIPHGIEALFKQLSKTSSLALWSSHVWKAWESDGFAMRLFFSTWADHRAALCKYAPVDSFKAWLIAVPSATEDVPLSTLTDSTWQVLLQHAKLLPERGWELAPATVRQHLIESAERLSDALGFTHLWRRFPEDVEARCRQYLSGESWARVLPWLNSAPSALHPELWSLLGHRIVTSDLDAPAVSIVSAWLHRQVLDRRPSWTLSYSLLGGVYQRRQRAQRARG